MEMARRRICVSRLRRSEVTLPYVLFNDVTNVTCCEQRAHCYITSRLTQAVTRTVLQSGVRNRNHAEFINITVLQPTAKQLMLTPLFGLVAKTDCVPSWKGNRGLTLALALVRGYVKRLHFYLFRQSPIVITSYSLASYGRMN